MPNLVTLGTLITRVRQRWGGEGFLTQVTDWEITDHLNTSLAHELYDLVRQAVGDQYYRETYTLQTLNGVQTYDLPADFLSLISVDAWLTAPGVPGATSLKLTCHRYMEDERNLYQQILLGWFAGGTVLYSLTGKNITFQPTPIQAFYITLNYVPTSPQLGGGINTTGSGGEGGIPAGQVQPNSYDDTWDDINGWSEVAVLDAASKCCLKLARLEQANALDQRKELLSAKIQKVISLRHAGEPERTNITNRPIYGDGWLDY